MPTLDWIGKKKVVNHHLEVPFRVLNKTYTYSVENEMSLSDSIRQSINKIPPSSPRMTDSSNKIIHGDNLEALKSLLPEYEGKIDCIYIDPPYNTGNEGWIYNDNVNDPRIKKWLGEVVGKESEDFTRHDKWLCMMYPRLKLLQKLLSENGAIFISIDDNEQANLKLVCDEIFGSVNFVANVSWQRTYSIRNDSKGIPSEVEHIMIYAKQVNLWQPKKLERTESMNKLYKNPDNDPHGMWRNASSVASEGATHQGMVYAIQHPFTGEMIYPSDTAHWRYSQDQMLHYMNEWCPYELKDLHDEKERAKVCGIAVQDIRKGVKAIVLKNTLEESRKQAEQVIKGVLPRFYFTNGGKGGIARKVYLEGLSGRIITNFFNYEECGHTDEAKKEIKTIFGGSAPFDTPKPTRLIERILQIATNKDSIILDSFAGSGTTAHAVLNMNRKDGGNRKFILIEMMDYAESITAERVKRVINGYGDVEGTGGDFSFYELGEPLLLNGLINEKVDIQNIREYIWFTETHTKIPVSSTGMTVDKNAMTADKNVIGGLDPTISDNEYFLGKHNNASYWFFYKKNEETCLNYDFLSTMKTKADQYIIYADVCRLPESFLKEHNIVFKKIPREIQKF